MPCQDCTASRLTNGLWVTFDPRCLYCGARLIQRIGKLPIPQDKATARRKQVLADWCALGHAESEIRALAKGPMAHEPTGKER